MAKTKALTKTNGNGNGSNGVVIPFDSYPDYLPAPHMVKSTGMEALGKDDYKTPRIILLQGLSPQLENFETAKKDQYWHTGMNVNLGEEFDFVPVIANKRVILWRPRNDQGGGILAFSKNGKTWDTGANQVFEVKLRSKAKAMWGTKKDVLSSRLTEFGSSDAEDPQSAPAATVVYEYLVYLPQHPELSPCVIGLSKTALPNGKSFNTSLAMIARSGKPICCLGARAFVESKDNEEGNWTVPNFKLMGYVSKEVFATTQKIAESYGDYNVEYTQEETTAAVDDSINY